MMNIEVLLWIMCALSALTVVEGQRFTIDVESGTEHCFSILIPARKAYGITGTFEELDDAVKANRVTPLKVEIYNPEKKAVFTSKRTLSAGSFDVRTDASSNGGRYKICIKNGMEDRPKDNQQRQVGLSLRIKSDLFDQMRQYSQRNAANVNKDETPEEKQQREWKEQAEIEKLERTQTIAALSEKLSTKIDALTDHMTYLKVRYDVHEHLSGVTFGRIVWWNVVQILALIFVSLGQIFAIRKAVDKKRYL
mmetsp:Transcript_58240/g.86592  ORF Transcript_58240/g.86592 Transcript_58240/m.86592 type:complete len:251 (+) Transcript_58240:83-835(+)